MWIWYRKKIYACVVSNNDKNWKIPPTRANLKSFGQDFNLKKMALFNFNAGVILQRVLLFLVLYIILPYSDWIGKFV